MNTELRNKEKNLANRLEKFVIKSGIADAVKNEAIEYCKYFDLMDAAFDSGNDELFEKLYSEQENKKNQIESIIIKMSPIKLETIMLNNLRAYAIEAATK